MSPNENLELSRLYPADIIQRLEEADSGTQKEIIDLLGDEKLAGVVEESSSELKSMILKHISPERTRALIDYMSSDEVADMLGEISIGQAKEILGLMRREDAQTIQTLMKYEEETAGSLMATEYIALKQSMTIFEAVKKIQEIVPRTEMLSYIYVVSDEKDLVGVIPLRQLFLHNDDTKLQDIMRREVISTRPETDQEEVARLILKYDLLAMPVVNRQNKLIGIITLDDILEVVEEEATEDILKMSGNVTLNREEQPERHRLYTSITEAFKVRMPWLFVALFGGIAAGGVIGQFESTLNAVVALAFFVPVIMDMGGNVGTQSSTIFIRGLALDEIEENNFMRYFLHEVGVGLSIGLFSGILVFIMAFIWQQNIFLGIIVGISMMLSILLAAMLGYLIPWIIHKMDLDPAAGSNPMITTVKDITSLIIYFSVASLLLERLL